MEETVLIENNHLPDEVYATILPLFIREAERMLKRMHVAYERNDNAVIKRCAHTLKGASLSFGAQPLSAICGELDHAAEHRLETVGTLLEAVETAFKALVDFSKKAFDLDITLQSPTNAPSTFDQIVLIDDDPSICAYNKALIHNAFPGQKVEVFTASGRALNYISGLTFEQHSQAKVLVLVDFYMPELDGFQFMQEVEKLDRSITDHLSLFLLTLHPSAKTSAMVHAFPLMRDVLIKPLEINSLKEKLAAAG